MDNDSIDRLIKDLKYSHGVVVIPERDRRCWGIHEWGEKRDFVLAQAIVSYQPHEAISRGVGLSFFFAYCYPACRMDIKENGIVHINSIGFPVDDP
ncbi:hypothetical protein IXB50_03010 [Leptothoe spongobia TAU-MAC 1115]|uniref:Uncharacterized protein n=2 Tax=Leptothoe TaxID=2651725 RepID=A0A947DC96_9CYAN|nr:hypothetical protein [Leptothoe spongobia TAU-MAC 1115]